MKLARAKWTRHISVMGLILALTSCQRMALDSSQAKFQAEADKTLRRMTGRMSLAFEAPVSRRFRANHDAGNGQLWGGNIFHRTPQLAASQCVEMARSYPQVMETFDEAMVGLHRCLVRIVAERNMLTHWMYNQGSQEGRWRWGYAMGFPFTAPYSQFSQQHFAPLNQFASQGYSGGFAEGE